MRAAGRAVLELGREKGSAARARLAECRCGREWPHLRPLASTGACCAFKQVLSSALQQPACNPSPCPPPAQVVAFVKGSRTQPACGFSYRVLTILNEAGADYEVGFGSSSQGGGPEGR